MQEERLYILRMLEEGKISADEAAALLEALGDDQPGPSRAGEHRSGKEAGGARAGASMSAKEQGAKGQELAAQIREAIRTALRSVPQVTEELRENWHEVRHDIQQALKEIKEEVRKGPLVDVSGLTELFQNLRGVTKGPVREFEEVLTGELAGEAPRVRLTTKNGRISVFGWDRSDYKLVLKKRVFVEEENEAEALAREAVHTIESEALLQVSVNESSKLSVSIEAWLPRQSRISLEAASKNGALHLEGVRLQAGSLSTTNGAVRVKEAAAERLELATVNGAIAVSESAAERLDASTTNGGVTWSGGAREAQLKSVNGSIRVDADFPETWGPEATSRYVLECVNGSVRLAAPGDEGVGVKFEAGGRRVDLGGDEDGFDLAKEPGGADGRSRRVSGVTPGFESASKRLVVEAKTLNGVVRIAREAPDKKEAREGGQVNEAGEGSSDPQRA